MVATTTPESDDTNNDDTATVEIAGIADVTVAKTAPANVDAGTDWRAALGGYSGVASREIPCD